MSRSSLAFHWQGVDWQLLADKALWHPGEKTLFIADPHFGKSASFRSAGIPVPEGATHDDCQRLSVLIERTLAIRLVILGDFFHNAASRSSSVHRVLTDWRSDTLISKWSWFVGIMIMLRAIPGLILRCGSIHHPGCGRGFVARIPTKNLLLILF